jgi:hypothetical protein
MSIMSVGRRPKWSAATPNNSAPTGRAASVSTIATLTVFMSVENS